MSANISYKRRCVIKKLDFENCVVTGLRTKARGRRKLRARVTQEIELLGPEEDKRNEESNRSPILSQNIRKVTRKRKSPRTPKEGSESPVLYSKRKLNFGERSESVSGTPNSPRPTSPIFRFTNSKSLNVSHCQGEGRKGGKNPSTAERAGRSVSFLSEESTSSEKCQSSYQIDSFSQESKQNVDISSVDSENIKIISSSDCSAATNNDFLVGNLAESGMRNTTVEVCESPEYKMEAFESLRKNYKKNSLLGRLQKVLQKQASEKLLWQHQKRKKITSNVLKFNVVEFWNVTHNFILKCESSEGSEVKYLIVDCRWVPNIKNIKKAAVVQLHPPWQKLSYGEPSTDIFINIICIETLNECRERRSKETFRYESVPVEEYEKNERMFLDSFFSSHLSTFLD